MGVPRSKKKTKSPHKRAIREASREAVNYLTTISEAVLRSEFHFNNDQVDKFIDSVNKYSRFIADPKIVMNYTDFVDYNRQMREEER